MKSGMGSSDALIEVWPVYAGDAGVNAGSAKNHPPALSEPSMTAGHWVGEVGSPPLNGPAADAPLS